MKIKNNFLRNENIKYIQSPNFNKEFIPGNLKYIIMHYTGGTTLEGAVETFKNKENKVSSHLIIDKNGTVIQMVPFNYIAWHAGLSKWNGYKWINNFSIGIEFVNVGKLKKIMKKDTEYYFEDPWGHKFYDITKIYYHQKTNTHWQYFPNEQIEKGIEVAKLLLKEYEIIDILGHSDISPERKIDPGPAFPINRFKDLLQ